MTAAERMIKRAIKVYFDFFYHQSLLSFMQGRSYKDFSALFEDNRELFFYHPCITSVGTLGETRRLFPSPFPLQKQSDQRFH